VSHVRGGICGPRDRHRDLFAGRRAPADDACGVVRGVIGFHYGKTTAEFNCAESQPAVIIRVGMTMLTKGD
jgi:hypothetical protein